MIMRKRASLVLSLLLVLCLATSDAFFGLEKILGSGDEKEDVTTTTEAATGNETDHDDDRRFLGLDKLFQGMKKPTTIATAILGGNRDLIGQTLQTLFTTADSCIGSKSGGWTDPDLGDFRTGKESPYCNRKCYRSFFCCPPQKPDELNVKFIFSAIVNGQPRHTQICPSGCRDTKAVLNLLQNSKNPITWFVHGLINDIYVEPIYNQTRDALLARGNHVVLVDWHEGNRLYLQSMANVRTVGALLGQIMNYMNAWDRSTCTGFSLGAHVCGEAGQYLKKRGHTLRKCEGIDPAGPGYDGCPNNIRLDKSDCGLVTVMHTSAFKNAGSLAFGQGFGTTLKSGHCDFWMNDGMDQPRCDNGTINKLTQRLFKGMFGKFAQDLEWAWECSHYRAVYYYLSQLRHTCNFVGREGECGGGVACTRVQDGENRGKNYHNYNVDVRDGTGMTGMRGKRQSDQFAANVTDPEDEEDEEESRSRRGLISSAVKGTLNKLGLRKKKSKEEHDREHTQRGHRHRDEEQDEAAGGTDQDGEQGGGREDGFPSNYGPSAGYRDDYGGRPRPSGFDRPDRGRPHRGGGGGGGRPDWLEGGGRGDGYGDGGDRPYGRPDRGQGGGGRGRPSWLEGGSQDGGYDESYERPRPTGNGRPNGGGDRPTGSNFRPNQGQGGDEWGESSVMGSGLGGGGTQTRMNLFPDDNCNPSQDLDFKVLTTGKAPFC